MKTIDLRSFNKNELLCLREKVEAFLQIRDRQSGKKPVTAFNGPFGTVTVGRDLQTFIGYHKTADRLVITFSRKPKLPRERDYLDLLKYYGFRWNPKVNLWMHISATNKDLPSVENFRKITTMPNSTKSYG